MVKNLPTVQETWIQSLDWEDPLGWKDPLVKGTANHSSILAWRIPMDRGAWQATVHGVTKSHTHLSKHRQHQNLCIQNKFFSQND